MEENIDIKWRPSCLVHLVHAIEGQGSKKKILASCLRDNDRQRTHMDIEQPVLQDDERARAMATTLVDQYSSRGRLSAVFSWITLPDPVSVCAQAQMAVEPYQMRLDITKKNTIIHPDSPSCANAVFWLVERFPMTGVQPKYILLPESYPVIRARIVMAVIRSNIPVEIVLIISWLSFTSAVPCVTARRSSLMPLSEAVRADGLQLVSAAASSPSSSSLHRLKFSHFTEVPLDIVATSKRQMSARGPILADSCVSIGFNSAFRS